MNEFERCLRDCKTGIKAYQNVRASLQAFEQLCAMVGSDSQVVLGGLFHAAVVTYAKPFLRTNTGTGSFTYPIRHLRKAAGFSSDVHLHLLEVRNMLVAHDDFEGIEPRVLLMMINVTVDDSKGPWTVPMSVCVANKRVSHPSDLAGASKLSDHVRATMRGVQEKLFDDLGRLRAVAIEHPDQAASTQYLEPRSRQQKIPVGGTRVDLPDAGNNPWLNPQEPDFSLVHNGFRYEQMVLKRDFRGPERITFPDGSSIEIKP